MAKKRARKSASSYSYEEIGRMTKKELETLVNSTRKIVKRRLDTLAKHPEVFSYAAEKFGELNTESVEKMSRNRLLSEVIRMRDFLNAKTSTVKGAKQYEKQWKKRIFGDENERVKEQVKSLIWTVYQEYIHSAEYGKDLYVYGSTRIQQAIGTAVLKKQTTDIVALMEEAHKILVSDLDTEEEEEEYETPNVFSGRGDNL